MKAVRSFILLLTGLLTASNGRAFHFEDATPPSTVWFLAYQSAGSCNASFCCAECTYTNYHTVSSSLDLQYIDMTAAITVSAGNIHFTGQGAAIRPTGPAPTFVDYVHGSIYLDASYPPNDIQHYYTVRRDPGDPVEATLRASYDLDGNVNPYVFLNSTSFEITINQQSKMSRGTHGERVSGTNEIVGVVRDGDRVGVFAGIVLNLYSYDPIASASLTHTLDISLAGNVEAGVAVPSPWCLADPLSLVNTSKGSIATSDWTITMPSGRQLHRTDNGKSNYTVPSDALERGKSEIKLVVTGTGGNTSTVIKTIEPSCAGCPRIEFRTDGGHTWLEFQAAAGWNRVHGFFPFNQNVLKTPGVIGVNDRCRLSSASLCFPITQGESSVIADQLSADLMNTPDYSIWYFNCTDWALGYGDLIGIPVRALSATQHALHPFEVTNIADPGVFEASLNAFGHGSSVLGGRVNLNTPVPCQGMGFGAESVALGPYVFGAEALAEALASNSDSIANALGIGVSTSHSGDLVVEHGAVVFRANGVAQDSSFVVVWGGGADSVQWGLGGVVQQLIDNGPFARSAAVLVSDKIQLIEIGGRVSTRGATEVDLPVTANFVSVRNEGIVTEPLVLEAEGRAVPSSGGDLTVWGNPLRHRSIVRGVAGRGEMVTVEILDIAGRLMWRTSEAASDHDGQWNVEWRGVRDDGRSVSSGVYLVRAMAGRRTATTQVVVVR